MTMEANEPVPGADADVSAQKRPEPTGEQAPATEAFPIVGVGASAGGLEAFRQLLAELPERTGMAFVLIQHLDPVHESQLAELLSKSTSLPVTEVTDGMAVVPDHVYIIPPNVNMALADNELKLTPRGEGLQAHLPVDVFFRSLASQRQSQAIGVVLSGTGTDGTLGLAEIKVAGGITFAQDEDSAEYAAMPLSAIGNGCVDFVLPPDQIVRELKRIGEHPYLRPALRSENDLEADRDYAKILGRLRAASGVDFSDYRDTTIKRRIGRRMALHQLEALPDYVAFLGAHPGEVEALYRDVLINVTSFFRDPEVFETLKKTVFPRIVEGRSSEMPIRIWVPGCSTGQEAYSLAMALVEFLDMRSAGRGGRPAIQIFGTDINDAAAVEKARPGVYSPNIEADLSPERLQRFFTKSEGGYRISKLIRDMCVFARHDLAADPPFSRLDLISCRNLLIYLSQPLQQRIIPTFHYALNPGGFLLLGPSETVGRFSDLFQRLDRTNHIYAKTATLTPAHRHVLPPIPTGRRPAATVPVEHTPALADVRREADRVIMGRFAPAAVLIDENMEILQFRGRTSPYLEAPAGPPTHNVLKMARDKLFLELRSVIQEAKEHDSTARREKVRLGDDGRGGWVDLEVSPIRLSGAAQRCFLVLFMESGPAGGPAATSAPPASAERPVAAPPSEVATAEARENAQLRQELASVREYLQAIIEQHNAANEELQSANEEIRSSNEELQSSNEEMQISKEELQSTNEELRTVNDELQARDQETTLLSDDLSNTLSSIKLPVVMLGPDLRVRRFTPAAATLLKLESADVGRPFGDVRPTFDLPDLQKLLLDVLATARVVEQEIQDLAGRWYRLAMYPYRTGDNRIDGVVLVWQDIDEGKRGQVDLQRAKDAAEMAGRAKDQFLAVLSHELRTPLTPVVAAVSMLNEYKLDDDGRDAVETIRRNVDLQARLIDDLLDVTRIERGKVELVRERADVQRVIEQAIEVCRTDMEARELTLGTDWGPAPYWAEVDVSRLMQVFWNLLRNAIKFTPHGGHIDVKCHREAAPEGDTSHVLVEVIDNGIGIEPEALLRLFKSFEQAERSITQRFGGLGLGLTICRAMVELHGGTIEAHSDGKDKGATFQVRLPLVGADERTGAAPATGSAAPRPAAAQRRLRVLLVEDHGDTARIMARLLTKAGHEVHTAGDVASALQLASGRDFDLLLSDLGLPDGSGIGLMQELRRRGNLLPGIALSGYGQEEDVRRSREAGFIQHLIKPVSGPRLLEVVAAAGGHT